MKSFDTELFNLLQDDLKRLEQFLNRQIYPQIHGLDEKLKYIFHPAGKRFRASLVFLSARMVNEDFSEEQAQRLLQAASSVELLHNASLVHDDILDEASLRRGKITINKKWNNETALIVGDYLCAHSFSMMASLNNVEAYELHAATAKKIVLGEAEELFLKDDCSISPDEAEDAYFRIIENKTASLIATSCHLGAMLAGANPDEIESLRQFGLNIGIAFQIIDDILNITNADEQLGKNGLSDLRENLLTLPVISYLSKYEKSVRDYKSIPEDEKFEVANAIKADARIIEECYDRALDFLNRSLSFLEPFGASRYKNALMEISKLSLLRSA
jgi:geranylgeranyl pyrophosphate synthase